MGLTAVIVKFRDRSSCIALSRHKVLLAQLTQLEEQEEKNTMTAMTAKPVVRDGQDGMNVHLFTEFQHQQKKMLLLLVYLALPQKSASRIMPAQLARECPNIGQLLARKGNAQFKGTHMENVVQTPTAINAYMAVMKT